MGDPYNGVLLSHERSEALVHPAAWVGLEDTVLSERRDTSHMRCGRIYMDVQVSTSMETEGRLVAA